MQICYEALDEEEERDKSQKEMKMISVSLLTFSKKKHDSSVCVKYFKVLYNLTNENIFTNAYGCMHSPTTY